MGIFARIFHELVKRNVKTEMIMINETHLKAHRTAASLRKKIGASKTAVRADKGRHNSKLHVFYDSKRRPLQMCLSAGQTNDYIGAAGLLRFVPRVKYLLADCGDVAGRFRKALTDMNITRGIPSMQNCKVPVPHDAALFKKRHKIEMLPWRWNRWRSDRRIKS